MSGREPEIRSVVVERELPHAPEKIWRALTQPHLIQEWLMSNDFAPAIGHRFKLQAAAGRVLDCEVLTVEPNKTLAYTWGHVHDLAAYNLESVVTFTLTPTAKGTHLRMEHSGFRLPEQIRAFGGASQGWRRFLTNLEQILEKTE